MMLRAILLLILMALPVCAQNVQQQPPAPLFTWQGLYLGAQSVTPIDRAPSRIGDFAVTLNAIVGIKKNYSLQFQFIVPVNGSKPVYRIGFDRRIF